MEVSDWVTIGSVIAVIGGWFINSSLNRKHEIFKKRLDYKLDMYRLYFDTAFSLEKLIQSNPSDKVKTKALTDIFLNNLEACQLKILMFGDKQEIEAINEIVSLASKNMHKELKQKSAVFIALINNKLRSEVGIETV